jgi:hypothetical protein
MRTLQKELAQFVGAAGILQEMQKVALTRPIPDRPGEGSRRWQELLEAGGEGGEGEVLSGVVLQSLAK